MKRSGFTILELIAVIGIIAVVGTAVVGGFSGMMKGISRRTAVDSVRRSLSLARQEACTDGNETYFYPVDVNRFAIVRRAGKITDAQSGSASPQYGGSLSFKNVTLPGGKWIIDEYADLSESQEAFVVSAESFANEASLLKAFKDYAGEQVFDMDKGVSAQIAWTPWHDKALDAWVFGISNAPSGAFEKNHDYGWVTHPVQSLPAGYVFGDIYKADGTFDESKAAQKRVRFLSDGSLEDGKESVSFSIQRWGSGDQPEETITITVRKNGKIEEQ